MAVVSSALHVWERFPGPQEASLHTILDRYRELSVSRVISLDVVTDSLLFALPPPQSITIVAAGARTAGKGGGAPEKGNPCTPPRQERASSPQDRSIKEEVHRVMRTKISAKFA